MLTLTMAHSGFACDKIAMWPTNLNRVWLSLRMTITNKFMWLYTQQFKPRVNKYKDGRFYQFASWQGIDWDLKHNEMRIWKGRMIDSGQRIDKETRPIAKACKKRKGMFVNKIKLSVTVMAWIYNIIMCMQSRIHQRNGTAEQVTRTK